HVLGPIRAIGERDHPPFSRPAPWYPGQLRLIAIGASVAVNSSFAMLGQPTSEPTPPADRPQPMLDRVPHLGGRHDEQVVAGPQPGVRGRHKTGSVTQDQHDDGTGRQPKLVYVYP